MSSEPHWLQTPWVLPVMQPDCACPWCASERLAQAYRDADARKQVYRNLAANGAWPYRSSRGNQHVPADDCTCTEEAGFPHGSPYWAAHMIGCPMRARLCTAMGREHMPASGQLLKGPKHAVTPALPPEQEIRKELQEFDRWYVSFPQLPGWLQPGSAVPEPGKCHECFLGEAGTMTDLCIYCQLRIRVTQENDHRELTDGRDTPGWLVTALLGIAAFVIVSVVLSVILTWAGVLP